MDCNKFNFFIDNYIDNEIDDKDKIEIEKHFNKCEKCYKIYKNKLFVRKLIQNNLNINKYPNKYKAEDYLIHSIKSTINEKERNKKLNLNFFAHSFAYVILSFFIFIIINFFNIHPNNPNPNIYLYYDNINNNVNLSTQIDETDSIINESYIITNYENSDTITSELITSQINNEEPTNNLNNNFVANYDKNINNIAHIIIDDNLFYVISENSNKANKNSNNNTVGRIYISP